MAKAKARSLLCWKKFGRPLFAGAWVAEEFGADGDGDGGGDGDGDLKEAVLAKEGLVLLAGGGGNQRSGVRNGLLLAKYVSESQELTDSEHTLDTGDDPPYRLAAHPAGEGVVASLEKDCRLYHLRRRKAGTVVEIEAAEEEILPLQGVGEQNCLVFSPDGTRLAAGGDDGHLRVIEWRTNKVLVDKPEAHKSIKDLDFSLDGALVASTSDDSACRIWDVASGSCVASLPSVRGEGIGFVRFSRDGKRPFLYAAVRKRGSGFISVFDTSTWKQVNSRKMQDDPISAFAISRDGRFLAIGSNEGDISVVDPLSLSVFQKLKGAHMIFVTSMEFSPRGGAILSVSADSSARVTPVVPGKGGSWQGSVLLLVIFILSVFLVLVGNDVFSDRRQGQSLNSFLLAWFSNLNLSGGENT